MATINYSRISNPNVLGSELELFLWNSCKAADVGQALPLGNYADRSIQISGTFGAGGSVSLQGSLDGNNWATLNDTFGNSLVITSAGIKQIAEVVTYIRPSITGDGTTNIDVYILSRRLL